MKSFSILVIVVAALCIYWEPIQIIWVAGNNVM